MPLSEKTKNRLLAPLAIAQIRQKCAIRGILGMLLVGIAAWRQSVWLKIIGLVLAARMNWVYFAVFY